MSSRRIGSASAFRRLRLCAPGLVLAAAVLVPAISRGREHHAMTDSQMQAASAAWFAAHPPRLGAIPAGRRVAAAAATFDVFNFGFDNGDAGPVDTARISVGDTVLWVWLGGTHTVTNGTGSADPDKGTLFNAPMNTNNRSFRFVFTSSGTYPFYCSIHEASMKGVVKVAPAAGVTPIDAVAGRIGFASLVMPNPARSGCAFRFALAEPGRVRAQVVDASGRIVATVVDRDFDRGAYQASWDGRGRVGRVGPGVYWVRLRVPGAIQSRRVVIER